MTKRVEFGIFLPMGQGGFVFSTAAPHIPATYEYNRAATRRAEQLSLGFALALAKWRGFGGPTGHSDVTLESLSAIAGLAECTSRIRLICTVHTMAFHPAVAAKMIATIDHICDGRLAINLVAGSNPVDHGQMGIWRDLSHSQLYEVAEEWITVAKRLWTEDHVDFEGQHYHLSDCMSNPKPVQKPYPPILCAATSDTGLRFTIRHATASLVNGIDLEDLVRAGRRAKELAQEMDRPVRTVGLFMVIPGETDADAAARVARYNEAADVEALEGRAYEYRSADREYSRAVADAKETRRMLAGDKPLAVTRNAVVGSVETITERIANIVKDGDFDWIAMHFPDYEADLEIFGTEILPRLVRAGIACQFSERPELM